MSEDRDMEKINNFVIVSIADSISKMSSSQIKLLADLLSDTKSATILNDYLNFAIQDKEYSSIEVQEPVY